jgi:hypothetical protein
MTSLQSRESGEHRAAVAARDDWRLGSADELASELEPGLRPPEALGGALASAWTEAGLEAHAAVAAYARFALQLLSLGAPPQLLNGAAQAMQEETAHAQACFSLARRYTGHDVGPGALVLEEQRLDMDMTSIVLSTVQRGCIKEAVSALAAREGLEHCEDAATREVLIRRQEAKAQQAQLAWRFVAWALRGAGRELTDHVRVAFLTALSAHAEPGDAPLSDRGLQRHGLLRHGLLRHGLLRHGLLSRAQHAALEQRVLREVVLPCMEALLARSGSSMRAPRRA